MFIFEEQIIICIWKVSNAPTVDRLLVILLEVNKGNYCMKRWIWLNIYGVICYSIFNALKNLNNAKRFLNIFINTQIEEWLLKLA